MPDLERLQLPLRPSGHTLASHIAALDLLATRLDSLPSRSRWPARVPINSKASFDGDVVHTNEVKVKVSGDWWVEMTAHQAADYVRQRKASESTSGWLGPKLIEAMLEEHARLTEGQSVEPSVGGKPSPEAGQRVLRMSEMTFDPLLAHPAPAQPPQGERLQQQQSEATSSPPNSEPASSEPSAPVTRLVDDGNEVDLPQSLQSLVDLVGEHLHDKLRIPNGGDSVSILIWNLESANGRRSTRRANRSTRFARMVRGAPSARCQKARARGQRKLVRAPTTTSRPKPWRGARRCAGASSTRATPPRMRRTGWMWTRRNSQ